MSHNLQLQPRSTNILSHPVLHIFMSCVDSCGHSRIFVAGQSKFEPPGGKMDVRLVLVATLCLLWTSGPSGAGADNAVSKLLDNLFKSYDKRLRPNYGKDAIPVQVNAFVLDLFNVDENNHEFTVSMYFRHYWNDPRLLYQPPDPSISRIRLDSEHAKQLWMPDTFFTNERKSSKHGMSGAEEFTSVFPNGDIQRSTLLTVVASCKMGLGYYPFDRQRCSLEIESYGHTAKDYYYEWKHGRNSVGISAEASSLKYSIGGINLDQKYIEVSTGNYSRIAMEFFLIRNSARDVQDRYFPAVVLTSVSFFTLIVGGFAVRTQVSLALMATMIIFMNLNGASMPRVSYQTAVDLYLFVCFLTIANVVVVNFLVQYFYRSAGRRQPRTPRMQRLEEANHDGAGGDDKAWLYGNDDDIGEPELNSRFQEILHKMCKISKYTVPIGFLVFNVIYWMAVLIGSSTFPDDFLIKEDRDN